MDKTVSQYLKKVRTSHGPDVAKQCKKRLGKAKVVSTLRGATLLGNVLLKGQSQVEVSSPPLSSDVGSDS